MKKPNITKGEWKLYQPPTNASIQVKGTYDLVCTLYNEANAKAISAVPDMIDALIEAHEYIDIECKFSDDDNMKKVVEKLRNDIEKALTKAGCK